MPETKNTVGNKANGQGATTERPGKKKPGRASFDNKQLWARRVETYRLWSIGVTTTELAEKYGITNQAIRDDLRAFANLSDILDIKNRIDAGYCEIARTAFEKAKTTRDGDQAAAALLREAREALTRLSKLHGFEKETNNYNFSATQIVNNPGGTNPYDRISDDAMRAEHKRRRLFLQAGAAKKSKKEL